MALIIRRVPKAVPEASIEAVLPTVEMPEQYVEEPVEELLPWEDQKPALIPVEEPPKVETNTEESEISAEEQTHLNNALLALKHLSSHKGRTLLLVRDSTGEVLHVLLNDPEGKTLLEDHTGYQFKVKMTERENALYTPLWR